MKTNQEILKEFENLFYEEMYPCFADGYDGSGKSELFDFIQQALEQKDKEIEELVEQLVLVKDNSKYNKVLLKLLNCN